MNQRPGNEDDQRPSRDGEEDISMESSAVLNMFFHYDHLKFRTPDCEATKTSRSILLM